MMARARQHGFSLIELMVGLVVSMICVLAIMAAFAVYEGKKRTTTSGNDAQQNGSYGMYALERELRTAGSGIVQGDNYGLWGCPVTASIYTGSSTAAVLPASSLPSPFTTSTWPLTTRMAPVLIGYGGTSSPDVIGIVAGDSAQQNFKIAVSSTPSVSSAVVGNDMGILSGDYLMGIRSDGTCTLNHITASSSTATQVTSTTLAFDTTNSATTGLVTSSYAFDLGQSPTFSVFTVDTTSNTLVSYDLLQRPINSSNVAAVMPRADGIVMIKALYGVNTTSSAPATSSEIDSWVQPTGTWAISALTASTSAAATAIGQIKAIRVAIVAQSRLPESSTDYTGSTTLTLFPDLASSLQYTININSQYRYKVYDTTIPIRNALVTTHY
jgi:type IV pilus assembly protein PilW